MFCSHQRFCNFFFISEYSVSIRACVCVCVCVPILRTSTLYDVPSTVAGFPVRHCRATCRLLPPLRRLLRLLPPLRRPLHRVGFLVRHCRPTDIPPLRRPLHRVGFLVRHCRPTDRLFSLPQHPLHRSVSPFAKHASHDTAGKCKL